MYLSLAGSHLGRDWPLFQITVVNTGEVVRSGIQTGCGRAIPPDCGTLGPTALPSSQRMAGPCPTLTPQKWQPAACPPAKSFGTNQNILGIEGIGTGSSTLFQPMPRGAGTGFDGHGPNPFSRTWEYFILLPWLVIWPVRHSGQGFSVNIFKPIGH